MRLFASIAVIGNKIKEDNVSAFAAECTLFLIMSLVPVLLLLMMLIKYTPLSEGMLITFINNFAPDAFKDSLKSIINQLYTSVSSTIIFITIISILWAAGKGFVSLIEGLNSVFDIKEHRNWFVIRLYSILYTIVFVVIIGVCLAIYILGNQIFKILNRYISFAGQIADVVMPFRFLFTIGLFTLFFTFLYVAIPNRHTKIKRQLPGALFSAIGWTGFSFFFSIYVNFSHNLSLMYGSLTTIVCAMLWLYVCMYIFLMGAEINFYLEQWNVGKKIDNTTSITHSHKH